jgi:hypothetical protein
VRQPPQGRRAADQTPPCDRQQVATSQGAA